VSEHSSGNHTLTTMRGRDPHERGRASTSLELLFDLTFVIAYGTAADELAHFLAAGHLREGLIGFCFVSFGVAWAWINFTWFASAFDTDDWVYRLTTMVQMVGVLVLALGIPPLFESLLHGEHVDNSVIVLGYVVMRVAMIGQWVRAAGQDPAHRRACATYIVSIAVAQLGWLALLFANTSASTMLAWSGVLILVELAGPALAERGPRATPTPWHAHHIAERYGLMVIIALGEGLLGTTAALAALVGPEGPGWSMDVALLGLAGVGLTFGIWWVYFAVPSGAILHAYRQRSFGWGYWHIVIFAAVVAVGAGLHTAAYFLEHHSELSETGTLLTIAVPLLVFILGYFLLYALLTRTADPFHLLLVLGTVVVAAAALALSMAGVALPIALMVLALTPWVTVVGYEVRGHRHNAEVLASLPS